MVCQSCGLELNKELLGTNKDGSKNTEYCKYCFQDGEFNKPNETFEEMIESCVPFVKDLTVEKAKESLTYKLKKLKRWK